MTAMTFKRFALGISLRLLLIAALCSAPGLLLSQVEGRVFDKRSQEPMAFVTVVIEGSRQGTTTDIDGRFSLASARQGETLLFTFVGYESQRIEIGPDALSGFMRIELAAKAVALEAAEVRPGINPAEVLMRRVIERKDENNPENCCPFTYDSYNKLVFSGLLDSAIVGNPERLAELDSNAQSAYEYFEERHLLLMESISERRFIPPGHSSEEVKASRVSGISNADFVLLGTQLQSFSFYEDQISLLDYAYLSPLHRSAISKYLFTMEDTTYQAADTLFIVSFQPRSGSNFRGMKGLLYINSNGYALENVLAEPAEEGSDGLGIKIRQHYAFIDDRQWFPVQLNSDLVFKNISAGPFAVIGIGRSYIKNIRLDAPLRRRDVGQIALRMDPMSGRQPEAFWNAQRPNSLDSKELETYHFIDSLAEAENFDRKLAWLQAFGSGKVQLGYVSFDLAHLMRFNGYEGFRLGGGLESSERLMRRVSFGGYGAYGFRDREWKGGGFVKWKVLPPMGTELQVRVYSDVFERGGMRLPDQTSWLSDKSYYEFFLPVMDRLEVAEVGFKTRLPAYLSLNAAYRQGFLSYNNDYRERLEVNENITLLQARSPIQEVDLQLRWSHREVLYQTRRGLAPVQAKNPVVGVSLLAGATDDPDQQRSYLRLGVSMEHHISMPTLGKFSVLLHGGQVMGDAPTFRLFNLRSSGQSMSVATPYAFETVQAGSVLNDQYAVMHLRHSFRDLLFRAGKFRPHIVLVHSMAVGRMNEQLRHALSETVDLSHGYVESGLELQNLIRSGFSGIGVGAYYRYGAANTGDVNEDLFLKLVAGFVF